MSKILKITAREVLDSRGNPTVEAEITTEKSFARAMVPSGASTGVHEALELRDGDKSRYLGKGVLKAVENVNGPIAKAVGGMESGDQEAIDKKLLELDGTENKSKLGANAILAVSMAALRVSALEKGMFLFQHMDPEANLLPLPMMNVINGGAHADSGLDVQEFMILPVGAKNFRECLRMGAEVFHNLKAILKEKGFAVSVGDEGGFAPKLARNEDALDYIMAAIEKAGYKPWKDIMLGVDVAASEFFDDQSKTYNIKVDGKPEKLSNRELINFYDVLLRKYPIITLEDGLAQDDLEGWKILTEKIGKTIQVVGDDFLVTNVKRIKMAIDEKAANSVLIKLNQIGTVTETIQAIKLARGANWSSVVSHRSGETEDSFIADFVVGMGTGQIKTGSLSRTDRVCKYNQLLRIEDFLGKKAIFAGGKAFHNLNPNA